MDSSNYNEKQLMKNKKDIFICKNCSVNTDYNSSNYVEKRIKLKKTFIEKN